MVILKVIVVFGVRVIVIWYVRNLCRKKCVFCKKLGYLFELIRREENLKRGL